MLKDSSPTPIGSSLHSKLRAAEPGHKPELDGIRGVALLAVMLSHIGPFIKLNTFAAKAVTHLIVPGWSGVELFFVLSGFLITGILLKTKSAENYFSAFYMRRFLRIFPIYYAVLTIGLLVGMHDPWWNSLLPHGKTRLAYYFYLQNWPIFWPHHLFPNINAFGHFWSLAVEEQFYLVWPLVIWFLPENGILFLCGTGLLIALPLRFYMVHKFAYSFTAMALTTSRMDGLLIGAILAILLRRGPIPFRWISLWTGVGAVIVGYVAIFHRHELIDTHYFMPTIGITGFALLCGGLLAFSQSPIRWLRKILSLRLLRTVGKYSYGMYVYHIPIYVIACHVLTVYFGIWFPVSLHSAMIYGLFLIGVTFLIAKVSYDYFEAPILALKIHFKPRFAPRESVGKMPEVGIRSSIRRNDEEAF